MVGPQRKTIVLAGNSSPIIKLLGRLDRFRSIRVPALFTEPPVPPELARQSERLGLNLRDLRDLGSAEGTTLLSAYAPDWFFNVNSTLIFPAALLEIPTAGCLNMHPGRLPDYAGLHAHQWAIRHGETSFGATLHWMVPAVDAGPVAYHRDVPVSRTETGLSLFIKCVNAGVDLTVTALEEIAAGGTPPRIAQDLSKRRVYRHHEALDGRIDWSLSARRIRDFVRAADYRPFQSPTYEPETRLNDRRVVVREVEETPPVTGTPGTVVAFDDGGVVLAAGRMTGLRLTVVELESTPHHPKPRRLRGADIQGGLQVSVGDRAQPAHP